MCIGVPMQVLDAGPGWALCDNGGSHARVDMRLVGDQPAGTWVLVFLGAAREVVGEAEALKIRNAVEALTLVASGADIDHLFADLIDREPQLPEHLRKTVSGE